MTQNSLRLLAGVLLVALAHGAASYSFLGCFKDSRDELAMSNKQTFDELSPDVCEQHCLGLNLPLFGLQNGEECWCGSDGISFDANGEDSEFCDVECSGDSEWICGGHSALSLYKTEPLTFTLHKPQVSQLASSAEYVGCFADDGEDRVLANMKAATDVTPEACVEYCARLWKPFSATQYGHECWCGGSELTSADYSRHGPGTCNSVCSGNAGELCGGSFAFSLYETAALAPRDPSYLGCYADDKDKRVFSDQYVNDFMTPEMCKAHCAGAAFYALQYGRECWCGVLPDIQYDINGPSTCNRECSGDSGQICGGLYAFDVYSPSVEEGACNPSPCLNGGVCSVDHAGGHICTCASGYGGMSCQTDTSGLAEFYIEFEDISGYFGDVGVGDARLDRLRSAAARWQEVISHTPCGGDEEFPAGRVYITLTTVPFKGLFPYTVSERLRYWLECDITATASLSFDTPGIYTLADDQFEEVVFHEIGHILGIGYAWDKCTQGCTRDGVSEYGCPSAAAAYNDLAGNEQGTPAFIVGTADGFNNCLGFTPGVLGAEVMAGLNANLERFPVSKITVAALEDLGYIVDPSKAEEYYLPV